MCLKNLVTLIMIENNAEFCTTSLVHNYIWLYHNYMRLCVDLTATTSLPTVAMQRWSNRLTAMQFEILHLLMLSQFRRFFEVCIPSELLQSIL